MGVFVRSKPAALNLWWWKVAVSCSKRNGPAIQERGEGEEEEKEVDDDDEEEGEEGEKNEEEWEKESEENGLALNDANVPRCQRSLSG